ncbi:hypothetical protein ASPVEDRAFT_138175 [Aspergillus versicolor CBS 583.65]|uniref:Amino acid permease/ SLC12A domain-containing protein n=1 Tax=Aspergillus versicolor CBS 583.65 TaxID=1036611 RepID=A0A1L9PVF6_ASPVE|nr:uncharacterized protein ASPVEDRAFT_138175 [Aspergillus versicolor CBS 583.65]OJJ05529.1 hypothetical protein ASPVEDRAFT_138175 [Aspergillus versicolor CBS 583.65]
MSFLDNTHPGGSNAASTKLQEHFQLWGVVGVMASSQATCIVIGTFLSLIVGVGGPPAYIWGFITTGSLSYMVMLSLAEICAVYPCSAGQIYWSAILSRGRPNRLASYSCGWISAFGWFLYTAGTNMMIANFICAVIMVYYPSMSFETWQTYLINVGMGILTFLWNGPFFKLYQRSTTGFTYIFTLGALFIFISLLIRVSPKQSPRDVFLHIINDTGWSSDGIVFLIATSSLTSCLSAFDTATHLADEVRDPSRTLPLVMIGSTTINFICGIAMTIMYMFCVVDIDKLSDPVERNPLVQLLADSLQNDTLMMISSCIVIIAMTCAGASTLCTASRTWWAFARLNGTPFPSWLGKIDDRVNLPMNALYTLTVLGFMFTAISMGSTTALNAVMGGGGVCVYLSYVFPLIQLLWAGRDVLPSNRYINLGRVGWVLNVISVTWIILNTIWQCFPLYLPATAGSMNYAACIISGIVLLAVGNWHWSGKRLYTIPEWGVSEGVTVSEGDQPTTTDTKEDV